MVDWVRLRRAHGGDEAAWVRLYCEVGAEREWIGGEPPFEPGRVEASFQARSRARPGGLWVVQDDHGIEMVGWFDLHRSPENWMYLGMGLKPAWRGRGVGRVILAVADAVTADADARGMQLHVFEHNERARRLYSSTGFVNVGDSVDVPRKDGRVFRAQEMRKNACNSNDNSRRMIERLDQGEAVTLELNGA